MSKSLMISIQPKHLVNILNGYKTLELRKTVPKDFKGWVYIYCTKGGGVLVDNTSWINYLIGNGLVEKDYTESPRFHTLKKMEQYMYGSVRNTKVVARFWFDEYDTYSIEKPVKNIMALILNKQNNRLGMDKFTYENLVNKSCVDINDIWDYAKPSKDNPDKQKWVYTWHIKKLEIFDTPKELSDFIVGLNYLGDIIPPTYKKLKRPPQSWQYIYERKEILK